MASEVEEELCLIDSGIANLSEIPFHCNLRSLDLHFNQIVRIENLLHAANLVYLDLSSNLIRKIEGLSALTNLKTLNLSANQIQCVEGLRTLVSLVHIDLSYNEIGNLEGFIELSGSSYKLAHVKLQGNMLDSVQHVVHCLSKCVNLHSLILFDGENSNPLCSRNNYEKLLFASVKQLHNLNNKNRKGQTIFNNEFPNILDMDKYLDVLSSSDISLPGSKTLMTPKIDAVLGARRRRLNTSAAEPVSTTATSDVETSHLDSSDTVKNSSSVEAAKGSAYEKRLEILEQQLSRLQQSMSSSKAGSSAESDKILIRQAAKRDIDDTDESDDSISTKAKERKSGVTSRGRKSTSIHSHKGNTSSTGTVAAQAGGKVLSQNNSAKNSRMFERQADLVQQRRDELELMCVQLMKDLESERVEHCNTQQAVHKLTERLSQQEAESKESCDRVLVAEEVINHLKKNLAGEREEKLKLQAEIDIMQEQLQEEEQKYKTLEQSDTELRKTLHIQEQTILKMEQEYFRRKAELSKKVQEFQLKAAAMTREVELVKVEAQDRNSKIHQLQELLANREQAHAQELSQRIYIGSGEFKAHLDKEMVTIQKKHSVELKQFQATVESQKLEYAKLEDEFREALIIEEDRFKDLQTTYEKLTLDFERNKKRLSLTEETIKKLNELIKEQNGRLSELSKWKHRVKELESQTAEREMRKAAIESIKQENLELQSQVSGLKSVIESLMSEKKQNMLLAHDHGRLEAKIEELEKESALAKKQLADEKDLVKIKSKIIDDQNETVKKLKESVAEHDGLLRKEQDDLLAVQIDLKRQIEEKIFENQELRKEVNHLRVRKDELKDNNAELERLLQVAHETHKKEQNKYVDAINGLEQQLHNAVSERNENRKKLAEERKLSLENQEASEKKMREIDDAFRKQLDSKEESHQKKIEVLLQKKQAEMETASEQRILDLENEMREILREKEDVECKYDNLRKCLQKISHGQLF